MHDIAIIKTDKKIKFKPKKVALAKLENLHNVPTGKSNLNIKTFQLHLLK